MAACPGTRGPGRTEGKETPEDDASAAIAGSHSGTKQGVEVLKFSRRTTIITMAIVVATSVAAFAFWTGVGAGTGQAKTGNTPSQALIVTQTGTPGLLVPGGPGAKLQGTIKNNNGSGVFVNEVKAKVASIVPDKADPSKPACTAADFKISGTATVATTVPGGGGVVSWSGLTLELLQTNANQDNCKNVTVNIDYTTV
jgi:hypothetical protein